MALRIKNLPTQAPVTFSQRATKAMKTSIANIVPSTWMSPNQPLPPMAQGTAGRVWDFPVAFNLNYQPRANEAVSFQTLRQLADNCDVLRMVIETRKDQIEALDWIIRPKKKAGRSVPITPEMQVRIDTLTKFFWQPTPQLDWLQWVRQILEQHYVYDAVSLQRCRTRGGQLYSIEVMDGTTISVLLDANGLTPAPPSVAYQQVFKGLPAVDFTTQELLYYPRNRRAGYAYGYPIVAQIYNYVNMAIKRVREQLAAYDSANAPVGFIEAPPTMTIDQITSMQDYWEQTFAGNQNQQAKTWWVPSGSKYTELKREILFDEFDEWIARVICYGFAIPPTPFIKSNNRATAQQSAETSTSEGLHPTMQFIKRLMDVLLSGDFNSDDLEFAWNTNSEMDAATRAEINDTYARLGAISIDEVRQDMGKDPLGEGYDKPMFATATGYVPVSPEERQSMAVDLAQKTAPLKAGIGPDGKPLAPGQQQAKGKDGKPLPGQKQALAKPAQAAKKPKAGDGLKKGDLGPFTISRQLINVHEVAAWAKGLGIPAAADMALSYPETLRKCELDNVLPLLLIETGGTLLKAEDGVRLTFASPVVAERLASIQAIEGYVPSILISPLFKGDLPADAKYPGKLMFGPETMESFDERLLKAWDDAAFDADPDPSEAQQKAGNYQKGHLAFQGLDLSIENPAGSIRKGKGWEALMPHHYGYVKGTVGADGDAVDVYVGPNPDSERVWVIDQKNPDTGIFDEHKCMLGFDSWGAAKKGYIDSFSDNRYDARIGAVHAVTMEQFKEWLETQDTTKPMVLSKSVTLSTGLVSYDQGVSQARAAYKKPVPVPDETELPSADDRETWTKVYTVLRHSYGADDVFAKHGAWQAIKPLILAKGVGQHGHRPFPGGTSPTRLSSWKLDKASGFANIKNRKLPIGFDWEKGKPLVDRYAAVVHEALQVARKAAIAAVHKVIPDKLAKASLSKATDEEDRLWRRWADLVAEAMELGEMSIVVDVLATMGITVATEAGRMTLAQFGYGDNAELINQSDRWSTMWAKDRAAELVGMRWQGERLIENPRAEMAIDAATRNMVRTMVYEALADGATSMLEVAERLIGIGPYPFSEERAHLIAATEIARAHGAGALQSGKDVRELGNRVLKGWLVADTPCPICDANHAEGYIELDQPFQSGDDSTPGHPNCRCALDLIADLGDGNFPDPSGEDSAPEGTSAMFDAYGPDRLARGAPLLKFNHNHFPAGDPKGGQFAPASAEAIHGDFKPSSDKQGQYIVTDPDPINRRPDLEAIANAQNAKLTPDQRAAIDDYQSAGYQEINHDLRRGLNTYAADDISAAIAANTLPKDLMLYRGGAGTKVAGAKVGDIITDKAFVSTTADLTRAIHFAKEADGGTFTVYRMAMPKGAPALMMPNFGYESEVLLPSKSQFRITGIEKAPWVHVTNTRNAGSYDNVTIVHLEPILAKVATVIEMGSDAGRLVWGDELAKSNPNHYPAGPKGGQFAPATASEVASAQAKVKDAPGIVVEDEFTEAGAEPDPSSIAHGFTKTSDDIQMALDANVTGEMFAKAPVAMVPLAGLEAVQPFVDRANMGGVINSMAKDPGSQKHPSDGLPHVVRIDGHTVVWDGTHRAEALRLLGRTEMRAKVLSVTTDGDGGIRLEKVFLRKYNHNHDPANGEFSSGDGSPVLDRKAVIAKIKLLNLEASTFGKNRPDGGLTRQEAEQYKAKMMEAASLEHSLQLKVNEEKVGSQAETKSTLSPRTVAVINEDVIRSKPIFMALREAVSGVKFNANTPVDDIMDGRNSAVSAKQFYDNFAPTREALRAQYGDTVPVWRSEGKQAAKATKNWATTKEFAAQFGGNIKSMDVPVANVVGAFVNRTGRYHELIIGQSPA